MHYEKLLKVGEREISDDHPTYFIADIAANHDGDLALVSLIFNVWCSTQEAA